MTTRSGAPLEKDICETINQMRNFRKHLGTMIRGMDAKNGQDHIMMAQSFVDQAIGSMKKAKASLDLK